MNRQYDRMTVLGLCRRSLVGFGIVALFCTANANAQGISVGPAPGTTQTFSPYLGLLRTGGGILPNYQQFVRPRLQLQDTLNRQQQAIRLQAGQLRATQRRVSTLKDPSALTTGVRSGFLQYSTFYPSLQQGGGVALQRR